jgi:hypothetical protein
MTVMEKVVGTITFRWLWLNNTTHLLPSIYTDVDTAIRALHSVDLVFGDLRLPNIMIQVEGWDGNDNDGTSHRGDADTNPRSNRGGADASTEARRGQQ